MSTTNKTLDEIADAIYANTGDDIGHGAASDLAALILARLSTQRQPGTRRVWWFTSDIHNSGTETELFASEEALHESLAATMRERLEYFEHRPVDTYKIDSLKAIAAALAERNFLRAWDVFEEGINGDDLSALKHPDDMYWWGYEDLTFPSATE